MKGEIIKRTIYGIAYGGIVTLFALTVLMIIDITPPISTVWLNSTIGFLLGIYFGLASFIFEVENWSPLKRTMIHYIFSIIVYFAFALSAGWIPLSIGPVLLSIIVFTLIYTIFWISFQLYFK